MKRSGVSRNVFFEDLDLQELSIVFGFWEFPATVVGIRVERTINETVGAICAQQMNAQRAVLFIGFVGARSLYMPGVNGVDAHKLLHIDFISACCFGLGFFGGFFFCA